MLAGSFALFGTACTKRAQAVVPPPLPSTAVSTTTPQDRLTALEGWRAGAFRGANIYQRRIYPEFDDAKVVAAGAFGPRYERSDFEALASHGANLVVISHPGPLAEKPPFAVDNAVLDNLDRLVSDAAGAGLSAVIALRCGPGRSEFAFVADEAGTWFPRSYLDESLWTQAPARAAWTQMCQLVAARYSNSKTVGCNSQSSSCSTAVVGRFGDESTSSGMGADMIRL